jgi:hypothetical protein
MYRHTTKVTFVDTELGRHSSLQNLHRQAVSVSRKRKYLLFDIKIECYAVAGLDGDPALTPLFAENLRTSIRKIQYLRLKMA